MDMATGYQANRSVKVSTPFGEDALTFGRVAVREQLSRPFELELTLLSGQGDLNPDLILGQPVTLAIVAGEDTQRLFHGLVTDFELSGLNGERHEYRATVRPWFWLLTRTTACRVFQGKTAPEIFEQVCSQAGYADCRLDLSRTYEPREYCVQYRETDFDFLSRLLEQEDIFYFFEHSAERHVLVLCDDVTRLTPATGYDNVPYWPAGEAGSARERDHLSSWSVRKSFHKGSGVGGEREADGLSPVTARGSGDAAGVAAGRVFTLTGHPRSDLNIQYLVTAISLDASADQDGTYLAVHVEVSDVREKYQPARITRKPVIQGTHLAKVVELPAEETATDDPRRVKVQLQWETRGTTDEALSCWVRVARAWGGQNADGIQMPSVGQDVIVSFIEGDPDRPLIVASVQSAPVIEAPVPVVEVQKSGQDMLIDAGETITLTHGNASITLHKNGNINIKGLTITLDGGGPINVNSSKNIILKGDRILQN